MRVMGLLDRVDFKQGGSTPPEEIDLTEDGQVRILWPGGVEAKVPFRTLRERCPCAQCVEEWTGRKLLDPATLPDDIRPLAITPIGSYAVQFNWSDGHSSGLYTWATLRKACG
jgi:DUF971 family protein